MIRVKYIIISISTFYLLENSSSDQNSSSVIKKLRISKYDLFPFIPYLLFLPALRNDSNSLIFSVVATMSGMGLVLICHKLRMTNYEKLEEEDKKIDKKKRNEAEAKQKEKERNLAIKGKNFFLVFGIIYVIIAGVSFTAGLDKFADYTDIFKNTTRAGNMFLFIQDPATVLLFSFFSVSFLFYHCGILFLSKDGMVYLSRDSDPDRVAAKLLFNVIIMFGEAVILYFIAKSIPSVNQFVLWVMVLMMVDAIWTVIQRFVFVPKEDNDDYHEEKAKWMKEIPFEWIHLDILEFGFLWFLLKAILSSGEDMHMEFYWLLLLVLSFSTVVNYIVMWKRVWSKIPVDTNQ